MKLTTIMISGVFALPFANADDAAGKGEGAIEPSAIRSQLSVAKRQNGPFGLLQDLSVKKVVEKPKVNPEIFSKAIAAIQINMVSVSGGSFYIGLEEIKKGEVFPLEYGKNKFNVVVSSIDKGQITFKNMDTQEQVIKRLDSLPVGVEPGDGKLGDIEGVSPAGEQKTGVIRVGGDSSPSKK